MELIIKPQGPVTFTVRGKDKPVIKVSQGQTIVRVVQSASPIPIGAMGGGGGSSAKLSWTPPSTMSVWMIPHNLGFKPQVTILDQSGNVVYGNIQHLDSNVLSISFTVPLYGTAELG